METNPLNNLIVKYKQLLTEAGKVSSGALINSITGRVVYQNNVYQYELHLNDYYKYLEYGVNGTEKNNSSPYSYKSKRVNTNSIEEWIRLKPVVPRVVNTKVPTTTQLAYAISRSIAKRGITPGHFLEKALNDSNFTALILKDCEQKINDQIDKITNFDVTL